jgi:hypothetical protein
MDFNILTKIVEFVKSFKDVEKYVGKNVKDFNNVKKDFNEKVFANSIDSIAKEAKKSIIQFPVVISNSISPELAEIITKNIQVNMAEYLSIYVGLDDVIKLDDDSTQGKLSFIKKIRGGGMSDEVLSYQEESLKINNYLENNAETLLETSLLISEDNISKPLEKFIYEPKFLQEINYHEAFPHEPGQSPELSYHIKKRIPDPISREEFFKFYDQKKEEANLSSHEDFSITDTDLLINEFLAIQTDGIEKESETNKDLKSKNVNQKDKKVSNNSNSVAILNQIDVKRVNGLRPLMLKLKTMYKSHDTLKEVEIVLGVKTILHPVESVDLIDNIGRSLSKNNFVLNFFRMTTGEISFFKDWFLGLDEIKAKILLKKDKSAKIFRTLERQVKHNIKARTSVGQKLFNQIPATTTFVLTEDEAIAINRRFNTDIRKPSIVKKFLENNNIIGLKIVDESIGLVQSWDDGSEDFERQSLTNLEKTSQDNMTRDLLKIISNK